MKKRNL